MPRPWTLRRRQVRDGLLAALGLAALGMAGYLYFRPAHKAFRLTITAGSANGLRHQMAMTLGGEAQTRGVTFRVVPTTGSEEALDRVDSGRLDMALVQGGLDMARRRNVRQVAPLFVEPLHLLVKEEIFADVAGGHLARLRGRTVNVGEPGSGTRALSTEVLRFAGLEPGVAKGRGDFLASELSYAELLRRADRASLPDAVFMVSLLPSTVAKHLVAKHNFRLIDLPFASAFALDALTEGGGPAGPSSPVDRSRVSETTIPAFTYGVEPAVPPAPIQTLGTRLLLVAHRRVDPRAVAEVLDAAFTTRFSQLAHRPLDPKLLDLPPELPLHPGTEAYLARSKPVIASDFIDLMEKEVSIAGGMLGGLFFLWQWLRRKYRRRRDLGLEHYLLRVMEIERQAQELEFAPTLDLRRLLRLQQELADLKSEALEKFAEGDMGGEELISGFLTHVSDSRNYLTRLVLHVRESLEEMALHQGRPAKSLWQEALGIVPPAPVAEDAGLSSRAAR